MRSANAFGRARILVGAAALIAATGASVVAFSAHAATNTLAQGNLLTPTQASFDDGSTGGWSPTTGASLAPAATPTHTGTGALAVRSSVGGPMFAASGSVATDATPAVAGNRYAAQLWVMASSTARNVAAAVYFADSAGNVVGNAVGQTVADNASTWVRTPLAVGIAPPGTAYVTAVVTVMGTAAGETHVVDDVTLTTASGGSANLIGPLTTSGNRILDGRGRPVIFRGFSRVGMEGSGDTPGQDELAHAKAWGANIIRIPLADAFWLDTSCQYKPTYMSQVDNVVSTITSMGMVALLDLHTNSITPCGTVGQQPMADYPDAVTFWQQVAARYKDNPLVAFELYNEPHDVSDAIWRSGGSVTWKGTTYQAAGMQQMYDAVRSSGATNLVVVSGNKWSDLWPTTAPLAATNVIYSVHAYTCSSVPPPACTTPNPYDVPAFLDTWVTPAQSYPVMIGEFGFTEPMNGTYNGNVIAYAEAHGWGWTNFSWGDTTWGPLALLATAGPGATYEPRPSGMPALAAFPGLDTDAPSAPTITTPSTDVVVSSTSVPVGGSAEPYSIVTITDATATVGQASTDAAGAWATTLSLSDGVHSLRATARDDAGNVSPQSDARQVTVTNVVNGRVLFTSNRDGNNEIYASNLDGTLNRLTKNTFNDSQPEWSPDGTRIAFTSVRLANTDVYVMNADGSGVTRLTANLGVDNRPTWSPDGKRIAFTSTRNGNAEIYAMNANGSGLVRLTNNRVSDDRAAWSSTGKIVFTSMRAGNAEIYGMTADGTHVVRLTNNAATDDGPSWSPDGSKILYQSNSAGGTQVWVMNADGTAAHALTSSAGANADAVFSPTGQQVAFTSTRLGAADVYTMNADGSGQVRLTTSTASDSQPSWQRLLRVS